jgi:hypothetical protein
MSKEYNSIDVEKGKLIREVRIFEAKKDLPLHDNPDGTKHFLFRKGDILEEKFDEPNYLVNTVRLEEDKVLMYHIDLPWVSKNLFDYKGTIPAENSKYFDKFGLKKIISERKRKKTAIAKANDRIAEIEYFLDKM